MDLIERCQAGDKEAFAMLFQQYKDMVYKIAYFMLGDAEEAEDALQEVFLRLYKALPNFDSQKAAFTTWVSRITMNYCLSQRRKRNFSALSLEKASPLLIDKNSSPQGQLELEEEERAIHQALQRLDKKLRAVVIMRYYLELPYAEIAQALNIPVGTVKSRLNLALKALRRELETRGVLR